MDRNATPAVIIYCKANTTVPMTDGTDNDDQMDSSSDPELVAYNASYELCLLSQILTLQLEIASNANSDVRELYLENYHLRAVEVVFDLMKICKNSLIDDELDADKRPDTFVKIQTLNKDSREYLDVKETLENAYRPAIGPKKFAITKLGYVPTKVTDAETFCQVTELTDFLGLERLTQFCALFIAEDITNSANTSSKS